MRGEESGWGWRGGGEESHLVDVVFRLLVGLLSGDKDEFRVGVIDDKLPIFLSLRLIHRDELSSQSIGRIKSSRPFDTIVTDESNLMR